jgi:hypothetical protein
MVDVNVQLGGAWRRIHEEKVGFKHNIRCFL